MSTTSKKGAVPGPAHTGKSLGRIESITKWMQNNQNWVYIAIIGFCLSVTILYKISQGYGT
jgi:hypothetical protein